MIFVFIVVHASKRSRARMCEPKNSERAATSVHTPTKKSLHCDHAMHRVFVLLRF